MSLKTNYQDEILNTGQSRTYNLVDSNGVVIYSNVKLEKSYTPKQEGSSFSASDVNTITDAINTINGDIDSVNNRLDNIWRDKASADWIYVGYASNKGTNTISINTDDWHECLVTVGGAGGDSSNRRVLASNVVPKDLFAIGYPESGNGRHQAYYNENYYGGIDFLSKTSVKITAATSAIIVLYYR